MSCEQTRHFGLIIAKIYSMFVHLRNRFYWIQSIVLKEYPKVLSTVLCEKQGLKVSKLFPGLFKCIIVIFPELKQPQRFISRIQCRFHSFLRRFSSNLVTIFQIFVLKLFFQDFRSSIVCFAKIPGIFPRQTKF